MNVNGSEDDEIHCLEDGGVAYDTRPAILEVTHQLLDESGDDSDTVDPFASLEEDDGELEPTFKLPPPPLELWPHC